MRRAANIAIWTPTGALVGIMISFVYFGNPDWPDIMGMMLIIGAISGFITGAI
jgi:hypothetical protein